MRFQCNYIAKPEHSLCSLKTIVEQFQSTFRATLEQFRSDVSCRQLIAIEGHWFKNEIKFNLNSFPTFRNRVVMLGTAD